MTTPLFTDAERSYLTAHPLGRLATIGPSGSPQVKPVVVGLAEDATTLEMGGPDLAEGQRYRNIESDPRVSVVIDDVADEPVGPGGELGRGLEIRGRAELRVLEQPMTEGFSNDVIVVHPRRVIAWNVDGPGYSARDLVGRE
jgi:pyridoxamine 5'-phosphate oxidase family protein